MLLYRETSTLNISCILLCISEEYYCPFRKTKRNKRNKTNSFLLFNSVNDLISHCVQNHVTKTMPQKKHQNTRKPRRMNRWDKTWYFDDYIFKEVVETKQVKRKKIVLVLQKAVVERNLTLSDIVKCKYELSNFCKFCENSFILVETWGFVRRL